MNEKIEVPTMQVPPLKKICMTIGQLPSSYLETMSYYEMLVWFVNYLRDDIIPVVNANGEATQELQELYIELQDYVNNYFDNLDVQNEINNKLEEMSEDGSLTELIKGYVDPIYEAYESSINDSLSNYETTINNTVEGLESQVSALASGMPIPVSSTSSMSDTTKIYLLLTDGYWYYYNGSAWTQGGLYQAHYIDNNQIKYNMLDQNLQNFFNTNGNTIVQTITWTDGYWNTSIDTPTVSSSEDIKHSSLDVAPGQIYFIKGYSQSAAKCWCLCDSDGAKISTTTMTTGFQFDTVIVPNNGAYLRLNQWDSALNSDKPTVVTKTNYVELNATDLYKINNNMLNLSKQSTCVTAKGFTSATYGSYFKWTSMFIPKTENNIDTNDVIKFSCDIYSTDFSKLTGFEIWDHKDTSYKFNTYKLNEYNYQNKLNLTKINDMIYHLDVEFTKIAYNNDTWEIIFSPSLNARDENAEYKMFNIEMYNVTQSEYIDVFDYITPGSGISVGTFNFIGSNIDVTEYIPSIGFTNWIAIGDSITEINYRASKNYLGYCNDDLKYINIINKGESGTGYKKGVNTFIDRISEIDSYDLSTDIITVMGSINDMEYVENNLGTLGDTTTSTLYGAMYQFFTTLFSNFNGVRVGCISPINWKFASGEKDKLDLYNKALEDTCKLFNVPFLNISNITNLRPENNAFLNEYYTSDGTGQSPTLDSNGVHPNSKGHRLFYQRIKEFVKSL